MREKEKKRRIAIDKIKEKENKVPQDKSVAEQIEGAFEGLADGVKEGINKKTMAYDKKIRDLIKDNPTNPLLEPAKEDFKRWTKKDWHEDFDINK